MTLKRIIPSLCLAFALGSCIQDEALNVEAAIDGCTGNDVQLAIINKQGSDKSISIYINKNADLSRQALTFTLSEGATITPNETEIGDTDNTYDFSTRNPRHFTVTSEDGTNNPVYTITIIPAELPTAFHFEDLMNNGSDYHVLYEYEPGTNSIVSKVLQWASGNPGFKLTGMGATPLDYPTIQIANGKSGKAIRLETKDTGSFGDMVKMPIAAGNLFIGSFDINNAVQDPLGSTRFGYPFTQRPSRITGYYKYKSGGLSTDEDGNLTNEMDRGDIYAVLYETPTNDYTLDGDIFPLDGSINPNIVLMARIPETTETGDQWTYFDLPFELQNGHSAADITDEDLANGKYKLAVVFSSSIKGGYFIGAIGSTLWIDEVNITCE